MSFLNPVNEPVLRFSSTDASAPQINYNARVAGDIKTVLKACLVTGYGTKASAGWTAVNETATVIEFVSPSTAMSDYRLGIDDTSSANTTWYYQYQDARVNPTNNQPNKNIQYIDKVSVSNGWQLLVTERGLYFVEIVLNAVSGAKFGRVTFWGATKLLVRTTTTQNIGFWIVGMQAPVTTSAFFNAGNTASKNYKIEGFGALNFDAVNLPVMSANAPISLDSDVIFDSAIYLRLDTKLVAVHVGALVRHVNVDALLYGVYDSMCDGRPVLYVGVADANPNLVYIKQSARGIIINLDYWEY